MDGDMYFRYVSPFFAFYVPFLPFFSPFIVALMRNSRKSSVFFNEMPRSARIVIPGIPHHVMQRGNRRQNIFFSDDDKSYYLRLLRKWGNIAGLAIWAYCLMDNHVHFVAVPLWATSLAAAFGQTHMAYTKTINGCHGWEGFLWQGRYLSYPMDDPYLYRAMRYVELNPVRANVVEHAADYPWSSARSHIFGEENALLSKNSLGMNRQEWADYLAEGLIESETELFRGHANSAKPLGDENFLRKIGAI